MRSIGANEISSVKYKCMLIGDSTGNRNQSTAVAIQAGTRVDGWLRSTTEDDRMSNLIAVELKGQEIGER